MECDRKFLVKSQNNGVTYRHAVPCGKCSICRMKARQKWAFRLQEEARSSHNAMFITLTYSNDNLPYQRTKSHYTQTLRKRDLQNFNKRLRYYQRGKPYQYRYFAVGEYGDKFQRPHYHIIAFNVDNQTRENLNKIWKFGSIHIGDVNDASVHYSTKYLMKENKMTALKGLREPQFTLMSKNPPIGISYIDRAGGKVHYYHENIEYIDRSTGEIKTRKILKYSVDRTPEYHQSERKHYTELESGHKIGLPRVFKEKMALQERKVTAVNKYLERMDLQIEQDLVQYEKYRKIGLSELQIWAKIEYNKKYKEKDLYKRSYEQSIF